MKCEFEKIGDKKYLCKNCKKEIVTVYNHSPEKIMRECEIESQTLNETFKIEFKEADMPKDKGKRHELIKKELKKADIPRGDCNKCKGKRHELVKKENDIKHKIF